MRATHSTENYQILYGRVIRDKIHNIEWYTFQRCKPTVQGALIGGSGLSLDSHLTMKQQRGKFKVGQDYHLRWSQPK